MLANDIHVFRQKIKARLQTELTRAKRLPLFPSNFTELCVVGLKVNEKHALSRTGSIKTKSQLQVSEDFPSQRAVVRTQPVT